MVDKLKENNHITPSRSIARSKLKKGKVISIAAGVIIIAGGSVFTYSNRNNILPYFDDRLDTAMATHEYQEIPWENFMTSADRNSFKTSKITPLPSLSLEPKELSLMDHVSSRLNELESILTDDELIIKSIEEDEHLIQAFSTPLASEESGQVLIELAKEISEVEYSEIKNLSLISLTRSVDPNVPKQEKVTAEVHLIVLQDKKEFLIYPLTLTLDSNFKISHIERSTYFESEITTRGLEIAPILDDHMHDAFKEEWNKVLKKFETDKFTEVAADSTNVRQHVAVLADEPWSIDILSNMYEYSQGRSNLLSITDIKITDYDANAITTYTLSIPTKEQTIKTFEIAWDRVHENITSVTEN